MPEDSHQNTPPPQSTQPNPSKSIPKRLHYDHSRSTGSSSDAHWYSWSGGVNPLSSNNPNAPGQPIAGSPYRTETPSRPKTPRASNRPNSRTRQRIEERKRSRKKFTQNWAWVIIAVTLLGLTVTLSLVLLFVLQSNGDKNNAFADTANLVEPTSVIYSNPDLIDDPHAGDGVGGALDGNSMVLEPWDGEGRLTVLLMGMDNRPGETAVACRTDTMIVISLDPRTKSIGILSIPRDTYVDVPQHGLNRINSACMLGNLYSAGQGPELAMQTVQYNFGIRVNEFLIVNFDTFISIIDRIGGITINNTSVINDPTYPDMFYGYDPFYLEVGEHHLNGAAALKYARSRHNSDDIDRQRRQQEIIFAAREQVLSLDMLDDLILQAPGIWSDIEDGVNTSLSLEQLIRLALFARDVPAENIHKGVVNWDYLFSYKTEGGASVAVPRRSSLPELMSSVFGENYNE